MPVGLLLALLTIANVPVNSWAAVGLKVAISVQELPGRTRVAQVFRLLTLNGAVALAEVMKSGAVPVFLTRTGALTVVPTRTAKPAKKFVLAIVAVVGGITPVPLAVTLEGDPAALCTMLIATVLLPAVVGLNRTLIAQELPGATVVQPLVNKNCVVLPVIETLDTMRFCPPVLETVMVRAAEVVPVAWFGKVSEVADSAAIGPAGRPVPLTVMLEGDPAALWVMETVAVLLPAAVGANCTSTVQELLGATVAQLLLVNKNCDASAPVNATPDTMRLESPVLVTVMV